MAAAQEKTGKVSPEGLKEKEEGVAKDKDDLQDGTVAPASPQQQQKAQADYTGVSLKFFHALGFKKIRNKSIEHVNDESVVYLVGKHVAIFNYENKAHRFILKNTKTAQIVAFCVSSNRRYIALSERLIDDNGIQVSVYNFNTASRVRSLSFSYLSKQPVVALDFSRDNKYLVTVTQPPDVFVYLWQLDKARLLAMLEVAFTCTQVTISPWAHWKMCTTGSDTLKLLHFADKALKPIEAMNKKKDYRFTCHAWFDDDKMIVGTEEGDILILVGENERTIDLKKTLPAIHEGHAIWSICAIGRGFVCGGDGGYFTLFERTYDTTEYFSEYKKLRTQEKQRIIDISISPNEENVVVCYDSNEMASFSLANVDIMKADDPTNFKTLPIGFHSDVVTALDVCIQKSIVVTASTDRYVRVWNFVKKKLEVVKAFEEEALSVACHPMGLRLVIGFKYRMVMFNLLVNDLHLCHDFPVKNCREVRFSHGGQYFAAVIVNRIWIFSTYTFECIGPLQGHGSMVRSVAWTQNDAGLVSAGFEGAVYSWKVEGLKREDSEEHVVKSTAYSCLKYDDASGMIAALGSNKVAEPGAAEGEVSLRQISKGVELRCIKPGGVTSSRHGTKTHTAEMCICSVAQTIFVGTAGGQLLLYKWPIPEHAQPYQRYDIHQGEILFVLLSTDEKYLFTAGDDHTLFMFDVDIMLEGRPMTRKTFNYSAFDDVCYILQHDIDERARTITSLETQFEDLRREKGKEVEALRKEAGEQLKLKEEEHLRMTTDLRAQMDDAHHDRDRAKSTVVENEKQLEALHMKAAEELEALYQKRAEDAQTRYQQLKEEKDDLVVRYENKIYKERRQHEDERAQLVQQQRELVDRLNNEIEELRQDKVETRRENEDMLQEMCTDYETELDGVKVHMKDRLEKEADELMKAKSLTAVFKKKFDGLKSKIRELQTEKDESTKTCAKKEKKIEDLERAIQALKLEINVRNDTISTSEKKILELKKQTAELEKLRYVLTFKFNELRKEVAPKEENIRVMNERVQEMDEELERVGIDRDTLRQTLQGKDEKLHVLMRNIKRSNQLLEDKERLISLLLRELTDLVADTDTKRIVYRLKEVIMKYNSKYQKEDVANERDKTREFERQRDYMEAQLQSMKKQSSRKEEHLRHDNIRKTSENALLVREINDLRHEKKVLATKLTLTEMHLKEAKALVAQLQRTAGQSPAISAVTGGIGSTRTPDSLYGTGTVRVGETPTWAQPGSRGVSRTPTGAAASPLRPPPKGGRLIKGSTRSLRDVAHTDPQKVAEIVATVERNNTEMAKQQEEIRRLTEFVQHLLARAEHDHEASDLLKDFEQSRRDAAAADAAAADDEVGRVAAVGGALPDSLPPASPMFDGPAGLATSLPASPAPGSRPEVSQRAASAGPASTSLPEINSRGDD